MNNQDLMTQILLVEDNQNDAELALHALKKSNLLNRIDWVKDGEEALNYLFKRGDYAQLRGFPRVVLLDLRLPKVDGLDVLRAIRSNAQTKELPVVILTSSKEEQDIAKAYDLGVNSFVSKPVEFSDFAKTVADLGLYWVLTNHVPETLSGE